MSDGVALHHPRLPSSKGIGEFAFGGNASPIDISEENTQRETHPPLSPKHRPSSPATPWITAFHQFMYRFSKHVAHRSTGREDPLVLTRPPVMPATNIKGLNTTLDQLQSRSKHAMDETTHAEGSEVRLGAVKSGRAGVSEMKREEGRQGLQTFQPSKVVKEINEMTQRGLTRPSTLRKHRRPKQGIIRMGGGPKDIRYVSRTLPNARPASDVPVEITGTVQFDTPLPHPHSTKHSDANQQPGLAPGGLSWHSAVVYQITHQAPMIPFTFIGFPPPGSPPEGPSNIISGTVRVADVRLSGKPLHEAQPGELIAWSKGNSFSISKKPNDKRNKYNDEDALIATHEISLRIRVSFINPFRITSVRDPFVSANRRRWAHLYPLPKPRARRERTDSIVSLRMRTPSMDPSMTSTLYRGKLRRILRMWKCRKALGELRT